MWRLRAGDEAEALGLQAHSANAQMLVQTQRWVIATFEDRVSPDYIAGLDALAAGHPEMAPWMRVTRGALAFSGDREAARRALDVLTTADLDAVPVDSEWLALVVQLALTVWRIGGHPLGAWATAAVLPHRSLHRRRGDRRRPDRLRGDTRPGSRRRVDGRRHAAAEHLHRALARHEAMGATGLAARDRRALAQLAAGGRAARRRAARGPSGRPSSDLTAAPATAYPPGSGGRATACTSGRPDAGAGRCGRRDGTGWVAEFGGRTRSTSGAGKGLADLAVLLALALVGRCTCSTWRAGRPAAPTPVTCSTTRARRRDVASATSSELRRPTSTTPTPGATRRAPSASWPSATPASANWPRPTASGTSPAGRDPPGAGPHDGDVPVGDAVAAVEAAHPDLGRHLRHAVRTGLYCCYDPESPTTWDVRPA